MGEITTDTIIEFLEKNVKEKIPIDPHTWVDAAQKLNVLLSDEHDLLFHMQQSVSGMRVELLEGGASTTTAKMKVEASDAYRETSKLKAKIGRIEEMIRIAKLQAKLRESEMRGYR